MSGKVVIGSRGSALARWQAHFVRDGLIALGVDVDIKIIKTQGDAIQDRSFNKMEGKGFFTKEIEAELLAGSIDLAVHSYKDLPTEKVPGLTIAGNSYREDPADWLVCLPETLDYTKIFCLKQGARIGTSSARRKAQLLALQPDIKLVDIRGNVPSRLRKLEGEDYDAIVLAAAGLKRLNIDLDKYAIVALMPQQMVSAPAQGVLAYQIREDDEGMKELIAQIHDPKVEREIAVERETLRLLEGGCQQPIGVYCTRAENGDFLLWASHAETEDKFPHRVFMRSPIAKELPQKAMENLRAATVPKKVFISRNLKENSFFLRSMRELGHDLFHQSLLKISGISFNEVPEADWVFFSSQNGVRYFKEGCPLLPENVKTAVIGAGTQEAFRKYYGILPDFTGEGGNMTAIGEVFLKTVKRNESVLFAGASNSLRSVQKVLEGHRETIELPVYVNKPDTDFELPECDILVFTSPMNAKAYLNKYAINKNQKLVAIGNSTGSALSAAGFPDFATPYSPDEVNLVDVCF